MNSYEVNKGTLALVPETNGSCRVYEVDSDFVVNKSAKQIMEDSCEYFGSTLKGRMLGTRRLTGLNYKVPVVVEETMELIFFPTNSPRGEICAWLALEHVDSFFPFCNQVCVVFKNGEKVLIPTSYYVMTNQILRSSRLQNILRDRKMGKR